MGNRLAGKVAIVTGAARSQGEERRAHRGRWRTDDWCIYAILAGRAGPRTDGVIGLTYKIPGESPEEKFL